MTPVRSSAMRAYILCVMPAHVCSENVYKATAATEHSKWRREMQGPCIFAIIIHLLHKRNAVLSTQCRHQFSRQNRMLTKAKSLCFNGSRSQIDGGVGSSILSTALARSQPDILTFIPMAKFILQAEAIILSFSLSLNIISVHYIGQRSRFTYVRVQQLEQYIYAKDFEIKLCFVK